MNEVAIIGAGFAGMSAALALADKGVKVNLIDKKVAMGGYFPLLDNQFPTNSCGVCFLSPEPPAFCPFIECNLRENINFMGNALVENISGEEGNFTINVKILNNPVNNDLCIDCGKCEEVCPVEVSNEFGDGIEVRKAVYKFYPKAVKKSYFLNIDNCNKCNKCVEICPTKAIDLNANNEKNISLNVSEIILTPGFKSVQGNIKEEFGFGINKNVLSSVQYERLISPSGPTKGIPQRPSDGSHPKSIAFLQCVGSRDIRKKGNPYCSSICCMFALKQAMLTKDKLPDTDITFFYMDIRAFGKDYEQYFQKAKDEYGINFIRCHVSTVKEHGDSKIITITYYENGELKEKDFDIAVLSLGFYQDEETKALIQKSGINVNEFNFAITNEFSPFNTNIPGIYAAGSFIAPKDIPETTTDGSGVAAKILEKFKPGSDKFTPVPISPSMAESPRVGVLICKCGNILENSIDISAVLQSCKNIPEVVYTDTIDNLCNKETLNEVKKIISDNALDRLVVGGCSVRELEAIFEKFKDTGYSMLNFEFVNLREQCIFSSNCDNFILTEKSFILLNSAIKKVLLNKASNQTKTEIKDSALVIGAGAAGMSAALSLAYQGSKVFLIEKNDEIGGRLLNAYYTLKGTDIQKSIKSLVEEVKNNKNIEILTGARITSSEGLVGDRKTKVLTGEVEREIEHGVTVLATGACEVIPASYSYNESDKIITQVELEEKIANNNLSENIKEIVMIQCVESREKGKREYCSRVCCTHALKNALKLKEKYPDVQITVLYRDIRAYGFYENFYRQARNKGIIFIPYDVNKKPEVKVSGDTVAISFEDTIINEEVNKNTDLLVLSTGIQANDNKKLADIFGIPIDKFNFFKEANKKTGILTFLKKDIFMCGLCHAPKHIDEAVAQGYSAAARASLFLSKKELISLEKKSFVIDRFCSGCGICVEVCPFDARIIDEEKKIAKVFETICEGCSACVMACPNGAAQQYGYEKSQILNVVDKLL
jgi:heterodisulfide reductase subunit A